MNNFIIIFIVITAIMLLFSALSIKQGKKNYRKEEDSFLQKAANDMLQDEIRDRRKESHTRSRKEQSLEEQIRQFRNQYIKDNEGGE